MDIIIPHDKVTRAYVNRVEVPTLLATDSFSFIWPVQICV